MPKKYMKELLHQIKEYVEPAETVVIEAAHIYADNEPGLEQQSGAILASEVLGSLRQNVHKTLLIDDIHVVRKNLDVACYIDWLKMQGYPVDETVLESTLKPDAHQLLAKIKEVVPAKKLKQGKTDDGRPSSGLSFWSEVEQNSIKVHLLEQNGQPTCCLLDASFYMRKFQVGQSCITLLPFKGDQDYIEQQLATLALLRKVKPDVDIINVFFDPNNFKENVLIMYNGKVKR